MHNLLDPDEGGLAVRRTRTARWVPWALFIVESVLTSIVIGILSVVLIVQLTLTPGAIFRDFDDILTWAISLGVDVAVENLAAIFVFLLTGLIVGIVGLPIRLIGPARRAWLGNGEVTVAGVVIGGLLTGHFCSLLPTRSVRGATCTKTTVLTRFSPQARCRC